MRIDRNSVSVIFTPADSTPLGSTSITVSVSDGMLDQTGVFQALVADDCGGTGSPFASGSNPPVAAAGGPYASVAGERITLDASASSDPDGDAVTCSWNFGDGSSALGSRVVHDYEAAGAYRAVVRATSLGGADRDTAAVQVSAPLAARAFTANGSEVVPVRAKRHGICARLQAVGGNFELTGLLSGSFRLHSQGTGEISEIGSTPSKVGTVADSDHDGVSEVEECFAAQDLARLFSSLRGRSSVDCILAARLVSGAKVEAPLTLTVVALPAKLQAAVSPNPLNPNGVLRIDLTQASAVTVRLFDASGRLVRKIGRPQMAEGPHVLEIDGRDDHGSPLASGVYFYKVVTLEGTTTGRFAVLK
jgi:hypothetical protein